MIVVTIDSTNRTRLIDYPSLKITEVATNHPNTCQFIIKKFGGRSYVPAVREEVIINQDGTKVFAGHIYNVTEIYDTLDYIAYLVRCIDYTKLMDSRLIADTYENQTVNQILASIKSTYLHNDITINNVDVSTVIRYIAFNYETVSDALRQLAELTDSDWYIDYNKDIHFFHRNIVSAAFNLTDTNGKYIYKSLKIRRDLTQLRNIIFVRGGEYLGDLTTAEYLGDGTRRIFHLPYKFSNLSMTITGQTKNVGIDPIQFEGEFDAMHNFQEKFVRIRADKIPSNAASVKIKGNPHLPVIIKQRDSASIGAFTGQEHVIIDKSIKSKAGARQRALAELITYSTTLSEGEFKTYQSGLIPGSKINVQSDLRGLNENFIINRIEAKTLATDASDGSFKFIFEVGLVTTKTFDHVNLLQRLLNSKKKEIVVDPNEVVDTVEAIDDEEIIINEVFTASIKHNPQSETLIIGELNEANKDYNPQFVLGLWTSGPEEGTKRQFILNGSPLGPV